MGLLGRKLLKTTFRYCVSSISNIYVCVRDVRKIFSEKKIKIVHQDDLEGRVIATWNGNFYSVYERFDFSGHRKGEGGESEEILILEATPEQIPLLTSINFQPYETSQNDEEDKENRIKMEMTTYLLEEEPFARLIYEQIQEKLSK